MNRPFLRWLPLGLRIGFGLLLLYASYEKLLAPFAFAEAVENYRVFGTFISQLSAVFIPAFELVLGIMLLAGFWKESVALMNLLLMTAFLILVAQAAFRGLDIVCGCFGSESSKVGWIKLSENLLYFAFAGLYYYLTIRPFKG